MATADATAPHLDRSLPDSWTQITRVAQYELLNFARSRRFIVLLGITGAIAALFTVLIAHYRPESLLVGPIAFYGTFWGVAIAFLVDLAAVFFAGDAISGEFQNKTGYFLFGNPVRRSSIYLGKATAAFVAGLLVILIYAAVAVGNGWYYLGPPPMVFLESVAFSVLYLLSVIGVTLLFSSLFKSGAMSILVSLLLFLFAFAVIEDVIVALVHIEPWFMITYGSAIITNVINASYPAHIVHSHPFGLAGPVTTTYTATIPEGVAIMLTYAIVGAVLGYLLFRRQDFT